jgi:S-adenosylmethionine-diacylgycerolhomoserine-N-methlytransferase
LLICPIKKYQGILMFANVATVWHMLKGARGDSHAERLESFYSKQADNYDSFRERLLHGRAALIEQLPVNDGSHIIELGGGTGRNLEFFGDRIRRAERVEIVDLCPSLLDVARQRAKGRSWHQVDCIEADATHWKSPHGQADIVYCSYSLTMIPDWFAAIDNALAMLKPGGLLGVVDFYVSRKHPSAGRARHRLHTRHFWPLWFGHDNVHPNPDLLPYLERKHERVHVEESLGHVPYIPFSKVPYFIFTGTKSI